MNPPRRPAAGFTLIEVLLASTMAALILLAVYSVFQQAMRVRNSATQRIHDARQRMRAEKTIRDDLRNVLVSGGVLASLFAGDSTSPDRQSTSDASATSFPGYLKFTTTTGRNDASGLYGDVQEVEYYVARDPNATDSNAPGVLMRAVTRDLLDTGTGLSSSSTSGAASPSTNGAASATNNAAENETAVLTGVQGMQVAFYDGANWQTSWQFTGLAETADSTSSTSSTTTSSTSASVVSGQTSLPDAVRIDIQLAPPGPDAPAPPPLEILVPWTTQPYAAPTPATAGAASGS